MIAESPISDARAKSEARRAKILAREAARLSSSKGEKVRVRIEKSKSGLMVTDVFCAKSVVGIVCREDNDIPCNCRVESLTYGPTTKYTATEHDYSKKEITRLL